MGRKGRAYWGAYGVSKFATEGLMQTLADELDNVAPVRANSINPGATRTSDLVWWWRQRTNDQGLGTWFQPSIDVQRQGVTAVQLGDEIGIAALCNRAEAAQHLGLIGRLPGCVQIIQDFLGSGPQPPGGQVI